MLDKDFNMLKYQEIKTLKYFKNCDTSYRYTYGQITISYLTSLICKYNVGNGIKMHKLDIKTI